MVTIPDHGIEYAFASRASLHLNHAEGFSVRTRDGLVAAGLFVLLFAVFWLSPRRDLADSHYTLLLSETVLSRHTFQLDDALQMPLDPGQYPGMAADGLPYQVVRQNGHLYSLYPPGSALLAVPYMAAMRLLGRSIRGPDGRYNKHTERRLQIILATLLMAATGLIWYFTARYLLPLGWSAALALAFALGTSLWSLQSRALWAETWAALLLALLVERLVASFEFGRPLHPVWCATLVSWLFFLRPPYAAAALALVGLLACTRRWRDLTACLIVGAVWLAGFLIWSFTLFHQLLPYYFYMHGAMLEPLRIPAGMAGLLFSPGRGLFLYSPFFLGIFIGLIRYPCSPALRSLRNTAFAGIALHLTLFAAFRVWWAGHCYGPRYAAAILPWFFLLGLIAVQGAHEAGFRRPFRSVGGMVIGLLVVISVLIHSRGAISGEPALWNMQPRNVDDMPARIWDWREPQFLAGWFPASLPDEFPSLRTGQTLILREPGVIPQLWDGWSGVEEDVRWAMAPQARIIFMTDGANPQHLRLELRPFLRPGQLDAQRIRASLNGRPLGEWRLTDDKNMTGLELALPPAALKARNVIQLEFPDARTPESMHGSSDYRKLGVAVRSLVLLP